MNATLSFRRLSTVIVILLLTACAGGGESGTGATSKTSSGAITGFGSVFVNGIEYDTRGSSITLDGAALTENNLAVGMLVNVTGTVNADGKTGKASAIKYADEMEGVVLALDTTAKTLNVMGQTVYVHPDTLFSGVIGLSAITVGGVVEVSGYSSGRGEVHATRIEQKSASYTGGEIELKGLVSSLGAATFTIGALTIDYSAATIDARAGALSNGMYVEVKSAQAPVINVLSATKIEAINGGTKGLAGKSGDNLEVEGIVTSVNLPANFEVNGQVVTLDASTQYENGTSASLVLDVKVEVEGQIDAAGRFVAGVVKFREAGDTSIKADVSAIDAANNTVTVLGLTIQVNNLTVTKDDRDASGYVPVRYFSVKDLAVGDFIEVQFYKSGANLIATQLIRDDEAGTVTLEGVVQDISVLNQLTVSGITVAIPPGSGPFALGDRVEAVGTFAANVLTASTVEKK